MLWFTFKVTFGTIPAAGWVAGWLGGWVAGKELIIRLAKSSWSWSWDLSLAISKVKIKCRLKHQNNCSLINISIGSPNNVIYIYTQG
jgi:hypothetical protein